MNVFRITKEAYSTHLTASGYPARWNTKGTFVIYTAESRSLACLENLVHRSGEGDNALYKVMVIQIPDTLKVETIALSNLKNDWKKVENYSYCQAFTAGWITGKKTAVLKVPSAIIKNEYNFLINPNHPDFKKIKLVNTEDFIFDNRF